MDQNEYWKHWKQWAHITNDRIRRLELKLQIMEIENKQLLYELKRDDNYAER